MKLCVDRDRIFGGDFVTWRLRRQRHELWRTVGYMKLCVDRYFNCG